MIPQSFAIGLVVALVGYFLQQRSWRHQHFEDTKQREFKECIEVVESLSRAIDTRLVATTNFAAAVKEGSDQDEAYRQYLDVVFDWMRNFSTFKSKIFIYFGKGEMIRFELTVHRNLKEVGDIISRSYKYEQSNKILSTAHKEEFMSIHTRINNARYDAFMQLRELNDRIANDEFGTTQNWNNLQVMDMEKISKIYILKRLLGIIPRSSA